MNKKLFIFKEKPLFKAPGVRPSEPEIAIKAVDEGVARKSLPSRSAGCKWDLVRTQEVLPGGGA